MQRNYYRYDYSTFEAKVSFYLIRVLKDKKRKLVLALFYCLGHENLVYINQLSFCNFFHWEEFKNF